MNGYGTTLTSPFRINVYAGDVQSVGIAPDMHFMVTDNVTLGFRSSFGASRAFSVGNVSVPTSSKLLFAFDFVPTLGYLARLNRSFSLWPNGGIGVKFMGDNRDDHVGIRADFEVPLVVSIVRNMYLALGPGITIQKELTKNSSGSSITGSPSDVMFALGVNGRVGLTF